MSDAEAQAVLDNTRTVTLAKALEILCWIMAQAPDDNTHRRNGSLHVVEVTHQGEQAPRAVILPIESWQTVCRALAALPPADTKKPPRRRKSSAAATVKVR